MLVHVEVQGQRPGRAPHWKWRLARGLYHRGWSRQDVLELFRFLDWVLVLPEAAEDRLWVELQRYEEQQVMRYVTSVERMPNIEPAI